MVDTGRRVRGAALLEPVRADEWIRHTTVCWLIQTIGDVAEDDEWLAPAERQTCALLSVPKRRRDWRLGRWTVKQALSRLADGYRLSDLVVRTHSNGAPYAVVDGGPVPVSLSISHSGDRGLCAIAPAGTAVGCDLERVEPRADGFTGDWFTSREQEAIARVGDRHEIVTLFWSAKESALKALGAGLSLSTHDVTVTIDEPSLDGDWNSLRVHRLGDPRVMPGWWRRDAGDLITIVSRPGLGRPVALTRSHRATHAEPDDARCDLSTIPPPCPRW